MFLTKERHPRDKSSGSYLVLSDQSKHTHHKTSKEKAVGNRKGMLVLLSYYFNNYQTCTVSLPDKSAVFGTCDSEIISDV